jgi:hypothetical protein
MFDDKLICAPSEGTYWLATFVSSELQSVTSMIMSRLAKQPLGTELLSNASLKNGTQHATSPHLALERRGLT